MSCFSNFSLSRWIIGLCHLRNCNGPDSDDDNSIECHACIQAGLPVFHSSTCDQAHPPEWEASAGSSLFPIHHTNNTTRAPQPSGPFGTLLDPRSKRVQRWNRAFLLARGVALAVDPIVLNCGRNAV
ncbi:hypothetical protein V6N13_127386 [Hibiscus sabdariffa]|uniref:Uncharacterized protein n=1 Tax=Hibiscus sabdariffa TaxID=183260 RepID=A0ABR2RDE4_9ROSI